MHSSHGRRISLVTTGLTSSRPAQQILLLAKGLAGRGWRVELSTVPSQECCEQDLAGCGVSVHPLPMRGPLNAGGAVFRLASRWRTFKPHVVHCHMLGATLVGRLARVFAPGVPVLLSTAHGTGQSSAWTRWAYRCTDFLSDLTTHVSSDGLARYQSERLCRREKSAWIPYAMDAATRSVDDSLRQAKRASLGWEDSFVWITSTDLAGTTDYAALLQGIAQMPGHNKPLLAIAGADCLPASCRTIADRPGIRDRVRLLGRRSNFQEFLPAADGFLLASAPSYRSQAMPQSWLEAAAAGLPSVTLRVRGISDFADHGCTGFLTVSHAQLLDAMRSIMEMPRARRVEMGQTARLRVEASYSSSRVLSKWENVYEHLLQEKLFSLRPRGWKSWFLFGKGDLWRRS